MPTKIDFIGGTTKRCLMAMALPMIAAMSLNMMYNLVDLSLIHIYAGGHAPGVPAGDV